LTILRDSLTNTNPQVRLYTLQLFNVSFSPSLFSLALFQPLVFPVQIVLTLADHSIVSHKIVPALITLASDDDM
jgi:hypothetical protein